MPTAEQTKCQLKPLGDRVAIEILDEDTQVTSGGIYIPDTAREKPQKGRIVAMGAGRKDDSGKVIAMDVQVGQVVLFAKYAGTDVKYGDQEVKILSEKDILAILEG
jgi:chaperonin GroES